VQWSGILCSNPNLAWRSNNRNPITIS
jgi:hypothetical protein